METYFAPQNIQNDFNLRQKMTTDGYIDIDLLLDLKLISDLASNRDILIEAISRSKLLVMNTGCTMVKYMPLLERNVLILRDIATSTEKSEIEKIFDNENCCKPSEIHSDIGNNWFCQFKTEEECLKTAKYLQQFGKFNDEKLHVRVKAIHDKNKADTSPQMQQPSPPKKSKQSVMPQTQATYNAYSPGYYNNPPPQYAAAYYGAAIDPYSYPPSGVYPPQSTGTGTGTGATGGTGAGGTGNINKSSSSSSSSSPSRSNRSSGKRSSGKDNKRSSRDQESPSPSNTKNGQQQKARTPSSPLNQQQNITTTQEEERTAISDYPGTFDKYDQDKFVKVYESMTNQQLVIPQSMRGRDLRIISEEILIPVILKPEDINDDNDDDQDDKKTNRKRGSKKKRRKKREMSGTYYEDEGDVYNDDGQYQDDGYYYDDDDDVDVDDDDYYQRRGQSYYYEIPNDEDNAYYYNYQTSNNRLRGPRKSTGQGSGYGGSGRGRGRGRTRGRGRGRGRGRRGRRRSNRSSYYDDDDYYYNQGSGRKRGSRNRGYNQEQGRQYRSKRSNKNKNNNNNNNNGDKGQKKQTWAPRAAKQYNTKQGVYRTKQSQTSSTTY